MAELTAAERYALEAKHTQKRIVELALNPVKGNFDTAHLREVNRRIFQDLPAAGMTEVTPGKYRPPVEAGQDWLKPRGLETNAGTFVVAYSSMNEKAQAALEAVLKGAEPAKLAKLSTDEFTKKIADIYAHCDYAHPFLDGNSRTLRSFTAQLAKESGYKIDWESFNKSAVGRDTLYIARDRSVNAIAFPQLQNGSTMRHVNTSMFQLSAQKNLTELLQGRIEPLRSIAFRELAADQAIAKHPELAPAYTQLELLKKAVAAAHPNQEKIQAPYIEAAKTKIQEHLQKGGLPPAPELKKAPPKLTLVQPTSDRGRDR